MFPSVDKVGNIFVRNVVSYQCFVIFPSVGKLEKSIEDIECRRYMEDINCGGYSLVKFANFVYFCRTGERLITFQHFNRLFRP